MKFIEKLIFIFTICLLTFIGCVNRGGLTPPLFNKTAYNIDKQLIKRINEYWHYRKNNMPEKSFEYEYRKFKGKKLDRTYKLYVKFASKAKIDKVEIVNVTTDQNNEKCFDLKFYLHEINKLGKKTFIQNDCWKKLENEKIWTHILSNKLLFQY